MIPEATEVKTLPSPICGNAGFLFRLHPRPGILRREWQWQEGWKRCDNRKYPVYIDANGDHFDLATRDPNGNVHLGDPSALTDVLGNYTLDGLAGGKTYKVAVDLPSAARSRCPPLRAAPSASSPRRARSLTGNNFGIHSNTQGITGFLFKGTVFFDTNKNGTQQTGEGGLAAGWEVYADINHDNKLDTGDATTFTNSNGAYTLGLTGGGTFMLHEIVPANWTQAHPTNNTGISITVNSTSTKTGLNFGDFTAVKYLKTVATTSGVVAWWTFDSASQANSILNGYTGTLQGSQDQRVAGKGLPITGEQNNTALVLNGTSSKVTTNLTTQQEFTTAATYNVWINLGSTPAKSGHIYEILAKSQFQNDLDLQVEADGSVHFYTDNGTSTSFKPGNLNGWHMVTAEFDTVAKTRFRFSGTASRLRRRILTTAHTTPARRRSRSALAASSPGDSSMESIDEVIVVESPS